MSRLSARRPIFHSEADFQHALAWQIHEMQKDSDIRLEYRIQEKPPTYLDIWLPSEEIAIELKYCTRKLKIDWKGESFDLKGQSSQDTRRYDFLKDIHRLEQVSANWGLAVLLTNDPLFWKPPSPRREPTFDADFRIHKKRVVAGELAWSDHASEGTKKGRASPICLSNTYSMHWKDYWNCEEDFGRFRYLAVSVNPQIERRLASTLTEASSS